MYKLSVRLELITGLALLVVPAVVVSLVFGQEIEALSDALARLCGVALISLAMASRSTETAETRKPRVQGLTVYNLGVSVLLVGLTFTGASQGILYWPVAIVHALFGACLIWDLRTCRRPLF